MSNSKVAMIYERTAGDVDFIIDVLYIAYVEIITDANITQPIWKYTSYTYSTWCIRLCITAKNRVDFPVAQVYIC